MGLIREIKPECEDINNVTENKEELKEEESKK